MASLKPLAGRGKALGFFVDRLSEEYQRAVLAGALRAAESSGVRLLCFVGGPMGDEEDNATGWHRVYDLAGRHNLAGIALLSGTLTHEVGAAGLELFCQRHAPLPACSIGVHLENVASILVENASGMRATVEHLVQAHGARRIALVGGPRSSAESGERVLAYRLALESAGIEYDEALVVAGDFMVDGGVQAVAELERRGVLSRLDAIAACNDNMAIGVLRGLEARNLAVPDALAVTGFDDTEEAHLSQPPLTTVRQPLDKQGEEAVRSLVLQARNGPVSGVQTLFTELLPRLSCGCTGRRRIDASLSPLPRGSLEALVIVRRERIVEALRHAARGCFAAAGAGWEEHLLAAFVRQLEEPSSTEFLVGYRRLMDRLQSAGVDLNLCDDVLSAMRAKLVPMLREPERRDQIEQLFHECRLATSSRLQRALSRECLERGRWMQSALGMASELAAAFDLAELSHRVEGLLPRLGIQCCVVVLYDGNGAQGVDVCDDSAARVLVGYDASVEQPQRPNVRFAPRALLPSTPGPLRLEGRSLAVLPLVHGGENLGHVVFDLKLDQAAAFEALSSAIATAVRGAGLSARAAARSLASA